MKCINKLYLSSIVTAVAITPSSLSKKDFAFHKTHKNVSSSTVRFLAKAQTSPQTVVSSVQEYIHITRVNLFFLNKKIVGPSYSLRYDYIII